MKYFFMLFLCAFMISTGCEEKQEEVPVEGESCVANENINEELHACSEDDLLLCICDAFGMPDNSCPEQKGTWVRQNILCTCSEWEEGEC